MSTVLARRPCRITGPREAAAAAAAAIESSGIIGQSVQPQKISPPKPRLRDREPGQFQFMEISF
jgi:hypothetical protein